MKTQNKRIELPGAVETEGLGLIKTCRNGLDKAQMAREILTGELPPTPRRPPIYVQRTHELKDRFEAGENPCDRCRWWSARPTDFPCYRCTHNNALPDK